MVIEGIVQEIVPEVVEVKVPILIGEAKLPVAFDNCAVNIFPEVKVPAIVNGTEITDPAQNGEPVMDPVEIAC